MPVYFKFRSESTKESWIMALCSPGLYWNRKKEFRIASIYSQAWHNTSSLWPKASVFLESRSFKRVACTRTRCGTTLIISAIRQQIAWNRPYSGKCLLKLSCNVFEVYLFIQFLIVSTWICIFYWTEQNLTFQIMTDIGRHYNGRAQVQNESYPFFPNTPIS